MNTILYTENLVKNYSGHCALDNVSINIPENAVYGFLGPNGAGKTSLIRIITHITLPDSGAIYYKGSKLDREHSQRIGYLPEERGLYKKMEVAEQLIYFAKLKGLSNSEAVKRTNEWIEKLQLNDWAKRPLENLSKGMQQKVQFISAVIHKPELIILDEPFTGFDPVNAHIIKNEILKLKKEGVTIVLSTHRMESVEELCDSIALINKSKLILEGDVKEIKHRYKQQIYCIEGIGEIMESDDIIVLEQKTVNEIVRYRIKSQRLDGNALLNSVMNTFQVSSFMEEIPSIESIFLNQVNQS